MCKIIERGNGGWGVEGRTEAKGTGNKERERKEGERRSVGRQT